MYVIIYLYNYQIHYTVTVENLLSGCDFILLILLKVDANKYIIMVIMFSCFFLYLTAFVGKNK